MQVHGLQQTLKPQSLRSLQEDQNSGIQAVLRRQLGTNVRRAAWLPWILWIPCSCLSVPSSPQQPLTRYILEFEVEKIVAMGKRKGRWMIKTRWAA